MRFTTHPFVVSCSEVSIIAGIHLVLIIYGFVLTIQDILELQDPFNLQEVIYVACYYLIHFSSIFLLLAGTKKKMPALFLPWMLVFLAIFTMATFYWLESVFRGSIVFVVPSIANIIVLGLGWFSWFAVFKKYIDLRQNSKN